MVVYKNIEEQIENIKNKNILIKNELLAKEILLKENYYNVITGYKDVFIDMKTSKKKKMEVFDEETYFEEIYAVYKFDRDLRGVLFKYISIVETNMKSYISDIFSKRYGTRNYLKKENFHVTYYSEKRYDRLMDTIKTNLMRNIENYPDIKILYEQEGDIPFWMLSTLMNFGTVVKFYIFMKKEDKKEVANILQMDFLEVCDYLKMLNIVRNIAAHNNILFNIRLDIKYLAENNNKYHETLKLAKENNIYVSGINDIMAIIIILRRFLSNDDYTHLAHEIIEMIEQVKKVLDKNSFETFLEIMGIPCDYIKIAQI